MRKRAEVDADADGVAGFIKQHRTMFEAAALFVVLLGVYGAYLRGVVNEMANGPGEYEIGELLWPLARTCLISGAPFALLAFLDPKWESEHAAPVALVAWVVVFEYVSRQSGGTCPNVFALFFVPLVFAALAAHTIVRATSRASAI